MIFLKKTDINIKLVSEWYNLMISQNYHLIDDSPSIISNDITFVEHRHDQSCFSLLMKKYNRFVIPDETYFHPNWNNGINYPIWAIRNKTGNSIFN